MTTATVAVEKSVNRIELEQKVKDMYERVARDPFGEFHFELGRAVAERLGYPSADIDRIPREAVDSFAGVGFHFDLAAIEPGESVLDLGSGSGMDSFIAALRTGANGKVLGVDMTDAQREKAERLRDRDGFARISYHKAYIEHTPFADNSIDAVISNGVINLAADKAAVFREAARAQTRWASGDLRHHYGKRTAGGRDLQRHAVGRVHRRRSAAGPLYRRYP